MASDVSDDERMRARERPAGRRRRCARSGSTSGSCTGRSHATGSRACCRPASTSTPSTAPPTSASSRSRSRSRAPAASACRWRRRSTRSTCGRTCIAAGAIRVSGSSASTPPAGWPSRARGSRTGCRTFTPIITLEERGGAVDYRSRRRRSPAAFAARYQPTGPVAPAAPGSLEFFLAERYLLYSRSGRGLRTARVHHAPYPLQLAAAADVEQTLTNVAGLAPGTGAGPPALVHYARGRRRRHLRPAPLTTCARAPLR